MSFFSEKAEEKNLDEKSGRTREREREYLSQQDAFLLVVVIDIKMLYMLVIFHLK